VAGYAGRSRDQPLAGR